MTARGGFAKRILGFAGLPFLSLITPFLFLPILARVAGADAWLAIAVGQSSGGFFALIVALGFNTVGPPLIALAQPSIRPRLLVTSLHARLLVWLPSALLAGVIAALVSPSDYRVDAAVMAVAMTLTGLSSAWFMIGLGRASLIAIYEISPRIVATVIAAVVVLNAGDVLWYPVLLVLASLVSVGLFAVRTAGVAELTRRDARAVREVFRSNRSAVTTEVAGGAYNSLAVTFVGATAASAQAAAYVSGDKLYRIGQYSVSALGNALQGWVVEAGDAEFGARIRKSLLVHASLGLMGLAAFALLGPWLSEVLFGAEVAINEATALGLGVATVGIALGTSLGRITLVGMGARRQFMLSVLLAAAVGVPAILLLSSSFGAAGGAWGLAIGETVSVCTQALFVWRLRARAGGFFVATTRPDAAPTEQ
ncbi:oligosaccharide flippase family protein [Salinibacterium amurskyense]|uniref:oligosaccharide flippase family protein n=1 Tax=Salinibacterium amurskyense TaxID=205941 RepID=UPI00311D904D